QPVGQCGNSGHSTEPHLHFHIQDRVDFWTAAGLPIAFDGVSVDGQPAADDVYLVRGTRVRPSEHG
ncbi:MAG: M23 family metallopeptidase, partial [Anaerolinea sp.]|nr:M23 family metallopeptidase [Anaerolinea sp.]